MYVYIYVWHELQVREYHILQAVLDTARNYDQNWCGLVGKHDNPNITLITSVTLINLDNPDN